MIIKIFKIIKHTMRQILTILLIAAIAQSCTQDGRNIEKSYLQSSLGFWNEDVDGLPAFTYTGILPYNQNDQAGNPVALKEDPSFILGNYMFTMYPTVSGKYQLMATQRALGRMNQGDEAVSGENGAFVVLTGNDTIELTGLTSTLLNKTQRTFGVGYARYSYSLPGKLTINRTLAARPSLKPNEGIPGFLLTVDFKNESDHPISLAYHEYVRAAYADILAMYEADWVKKDKSKIRIRYTPVISANADFGIKSDFEPQYDAENIPKMDENMVSEFELFPPALFISAPGGEPTEIRFSSLGREDAKILQAQCDVTLDPGVARQIELIIGISYRDSTKNEMELANELLQGSTSGTFGKEWKKILPSFPEADTSLAFQQELVWHAYNLEAMAMYNQYLGETKIPQNTAYTTYWGRHSNARDHMQHILPLLYYNKPLAKSAIRYMMKRHLPSGEILVIEKGFGLQTNEWLKTSDQQLYFFWLLAEYLRITGDYDFLNEEQPYYPLENGIQGTVLQRVDNAFSYLEDSVGTGEHGVIKFRLHDWNDSGDRGLIQFYNHEEITSLAESYLNTAMAAVVMHKLIKQLKAADSLIQTRNEESEITEIISDLTTYRDKQKDIVENILQKKSVTTQV